MVEGAMEMQVSFDWEHSPRAMIFSPIEYKESHRNTIRMNVSWV